MNPSRAATNSNRFATIGSERAGSSAAAPPQTQLFFLKYQYWTALAGEDCNCDHRLNEPHEEGCAAEDESTPEGCAANDVFIVEGEQERYGDKSAWEVVRRY